MHSKLRFILVFAAFLGTFVVGQAQKFTTATIIPAAASPVLMVTADFNRDGHPDIAYQDAYDGGNLHLMLGNGDGTFTTGQVIPLAGGVGTVLNVGDLNDDGIPDIAIGYHGHASSITAAPCITILLGRGDGTFSAPKYVPAYTYGSPVEINFKFGIADFDGDGHADIIYGDNYEFLYFMKGLGNGNFSAPVMMSQNGSDSYYGTEDVLVGDFNGDGLPDIAVGSYNYGGNNYPAVVISLNQGGAKFTEVATINGSNDRDTSGGFLLADMDGDGKLDVALTPGAGTSDVAVAYGLGGGKFATPVPLGNYTYARAPFLLGAADLHGDGHKRIFTGSFDGVTVLGGNAPVPSQLYAAGGDSIDESHTDLYYEGQAYFNQGLVADFNGDGYADVIMSGDSSLILLAGGANGGLIAATSIYIGRDIGIAVFDANSDGIPDLVLSGPTVYPGRGDGTFVLHTPAYSPYGAPSTTADFNGDGRLDLYSYGEFLNNGNGTFTAVGTSGLYPSNSFYATGYVTTADFNGDGVPDIALTTSAGGIYKPSTTNDQVNLAFSIGKTTTYTYRSLSFTEPVGPLSTGDFNGDGCDDLVVGTMSQIQIFAGDCHSNLTLRASYPVGAGATISGTPAGVLGSLMPSDIAVADFDHDGHLDIIYTIPGLKQANVLWGNGDGTFTAGQPLSLAHPSLFVKTADLDSDGSPDLIFSGSSVVTILHGTGTRNFGPPMMLAAGFNTGRVAIADVNRDGNPDMVIPNLDPEGEGLAGLTATVFINPLPPRITNALTTTLNVSPEPSTYGQPFTATATVTPVANSATPTGVATFTLDGGTPTTGNLNSSGTASATFGTASVGTHLLAVSYPGDTNFTSTGASIAHVVTGFATTTTLTCTPRTIYVDSSQTSLLAVSVASANGTPTGSISFTDNGTALTTSGLVGGAANYTYFGATVGTHTLTATYVPTGSFAGSSASCSEVVATLPTASTLTVSPTTSTYRSPVTLTATVAPALPPGPTPTGSVTFYNGASILGTSPLAAAGSGGQFANGITGISLSTLPAGTNNLTCIYNGSDIYSSSRCNPVPFTVTAAATKLVLTSSLNPTPALTSVTFNVHLTSGGQPAPAGNLISLSLNGQAIPLTTDGNGSATYSVSTLAPGSYPVTADFAATSNLFASSASLTEVVTAVPTSTSVTVSPNPAYLAQPVTMTASVTAGSTSIGSGSVTFFDGSTQLSTQPITAANIATYTTSALALGTHPVTATYSPTGTTFTSSISSVVNEVILPSSFTIGLTPSNITLPPGASGTIAIQLSSVGNFAGPLTLSYGSLPTYATASIKPTTVTIASGGTGSSTLNLATLQKASNTIPGRPGESKIPMIFSAFLLALVPLSFTRRRRFVRIVGSLLVILSLQAAVGCTNSWYTTNDVSPGTYQIPITATDIHGNAQSAILTVVVTP